MSQRVVITGGASGIGRAFARRFARDGWRVALCDAASEAVAAMSFKASRNDSLDKRLQDYVLLDNFFLLISAIKFFFNLKSLSKA